MSDITVIFKNKKISLPLNKNGNLNLTLLKQYCPAALGLSYDKDGCTHGLDLSNEEIIIDPLINIYDVYMMDDSPPRSSYLASKRRRIDEILVKIHGGKENNDQLQNIQVDEQDGKQRPKSSKTLPKCGKKQRTLHVGWLHRTTADKKYQQMKKPIGGIRDLKLYSSHEYSVNEIKRMAIKDFTSDENCKLMSKCAIKLGSFEGHVIEEFEDEKDQSCGLWRYCKSKNLSFYRLNLYLLTTLNIDDSELEHAIEEQANQDDLKENGAVNEFQQVNSSVVEEASPTVSDQKDDVRVFYHYTRESRYSGAKSIVELEKDALYLIMSSVEDSPKLSIREFEPLNEGYNISRIEKNGKVLLQIDMDANLEKSFSFPSADHGSSGNDHIILHDVDELQGFCQGRFGLGIIPNCSDSCNPFFTWKENGTVYQQGYFLYWINVEHQESDDLPIWSATVNCQKNCTNEPQSHAARAALINTAADQFDILLPMVSSIPSIKKEDLPISKILLGAGAQGKVRKGNWLVIDVAIKTVELINANVKLVSRELDVLNMVTHPNIIQTMATCLEPRQLHIVMELFQSNPLSDVLFDDDVKEEYNLSIKTKNFIGEQICSAVSYLHCQPNAIIHGDIKPDNFLLNMDGIANICDLGLSKFKQMATALRSTAGIRTVKG